jgi:hypothetical protein
MFFAAFVFCGIIVGIMVIAKHLEPKQQLAATRPSATPTPEASPTPTPTPKASPTSTPVPTPGKVAEYATDIGQFKKEIEKLGGDAVITEITGLGDDIVKLRVRNAWHDLSYGSRLDMAQNLQRLWAGIHSPGDPDKARILIRDQAGSEVGGSRMWGGTMIWVEK